MGVCLEPGPTFRQDDFRRERPGRPHTRATSCRPGSRGSRRSRAIWMNWCTECERNRKESSMNPAQQFRQRGQSLWLDNITRGMLNDGTVKGYIDEYAITGLTSNPSIFDKAIEESEDYDESI